MKVGLLDTIPPSFYLPGEKTDPDKFRDMFRSVGVPHEMPHYDITLDEFPQSVDECEGYLITGSPCSVYEDLPWIGKLEAFVRDCYQAGQPLVGVCFGHQLIAQALGGRVEKAETGWLLGHHGLRILREKHWMQPHQEEGTLYFVNQDQVVAPPPGAELLAENDRCAYAMFTVGENVLCIQPHPEQPITSMHTFIEHLRPRLKPEVIEEAFGSLANGEPHADLVASWLWQFLESAISVRRAMGTR
jgi:GMP synthase-like glutamine amidotransferase